MKKLLLTSLLAIMMAGPLASCSKSPALPKSEDYALENIDAPVHLLHRSLRKKIASEKQTSQKLPDGRLSVEVVIRNRTKKPINIETRTVFKSEEGFSTGDETAWDDLYLEPLQMQTIRATSKSGKPVKYTVEVRKP